MFTPPAEVDLFHRRILFFLKNKHHGKTQITPDPPNRGTVRMCWLCSQAALGAKGASVDGAGWVARFAASAILVRLLNQTPVN